MKEYKVPALVVSAVLNTIIAAYLFGPITSLLGIGIFCLIGAMLYKTVSIEDTLNSMTTLSVGLAVISVGIIILNYLSLFLVIAAVAGLVWYVHSHPNKHKNLLRK